MYFRQLRLPDIGCASYLIGDDKGCAVVDPRWDAVRHYIGLARQQGLQITQPDEGAWYCPARCLRRISGSSSTGGGRGTSAGNLLRVSWSDFSRA
jgi:hypothetical protein